MANQNGTAATILTSPGLFGSGLASAGTGNSAGGFQSGGADAFQFEYSAASGANAAFTSADLVSSQGLPANGTPISLGYTSVPFTYTSSSANPAVFTCPGLSTGTTGVGEDEQHPLQQGMGVILLGVPPGGFTSSVLPVGNPYNGVTSSITQYFVPAGGLSAANGTFQLATTQGGTGVTGASGTVVSTATAASQLMIYGGVPTGMSPFVTYFVVASGTDGANSFRLSLTVGGSAITTSSIGAGMMILQVQNQVDLQVAYGASTAYNGIRIGGFRFGLQPGAARDPFTVLTTATSMSMDESPQMAWQNVAGATCQSGNANTNTGASTTGDTYPGWGQAGGYSTTGASGQFVDELKAPVMHKDDNGGYETTEHRKVRLTSELNSLKEKGSPTAKERERMAVIESALNELK